jgi:hypothetical protein
MREKGDRRLRRIKLTYHRSATENPFTKKRFYHFGIGYESCGVHNVNLQLLQSTFDFPPSHLRKANLRSAEEAISLNRVSAGVTIRAAPASRGYSVVCSAN